ncbi:hypothetical protein [Dyadobacter sp. Leaf189]|uniref:hypothetical protein n=1 Tax=Dyadobacter sp. Leaf189 TaxID=1736295 RepID=UPI0006F58DB1|nr:hypothetical protein [Dyadobacter sp. Leaf189]KQS27973.1 hypothetical protein ASG33_16380 [Dyadobacter sp. Leaf189]
MKNKYISVPLFFAAVSLVAGCRLEKEIDPERPEKFDLQAAEVQLMDTVTENITGEWKLSSVEYDIKYTNPNGSVKKDTIFTDFATLDIQYVSREESLRYPTVKGELQFGEKTYPVRFGMIANGERLVKKTGPQAFMLLEYAFPGPHVWQNDEIFFRDSGLINENYSILIAPDSRTMVWKGLNRDIKQIIFKRQ